MKMLACRVDDSMHARVLAAVEAGGARSIQDWLYALVLDEVLRSEQDPPGMEDLVATPGELLAAARARMEGMEELIASQRDRLADSQAHNIALQAEIDRLNGHLDATNANMERVTLMLPAAGESPRIPKWQFWRRR